MATFNNGESGLSVRNKLNTIINKVEGASTIDNDINVDGVNLSAISETISDTAVDIFVYDTRKDSDGGAWRKRTQHTSWYNEDLNTSTRGSRKEFPAVAVIVAETNQVTIYDGDDPDLPMWMVFNALSGANITTAGNVSAIFMMNGLLSVVQTSGGYRETNFIRDTFSYVLTSTDNTAQGVVNRNTANLTVSGGSRRIADNDVNDVAMTVLPNAPIDAATGLPVPTIAVATDGGLSVIKDDGVVVDSASTGTYRNVSFVPSGNLIATESQGSFSTEVYENYSNDSFGFARRYDNTGTSDVHTIDAMRDGIGFEESIAIYRDGYGNGIFLINEENTDDPRDNGLGATIKSDYNTGWMNGDIKLATLSDTTVESVTQSDDLITNHDFTVSTGWTLTGFSIDTTDQQLDDTASSGSNNADSSGFDLEDNTTYVLTLKHAGSGGRPTIALLESDETQILQVQTPTDPFDGIMTHTFTTTSAYTDAFIRITGTAYTGSYDYVSLRKAEEDRSVNGNGLQAFTTGGTINKNAVATGSDLVAYSGFSGASNPRYLQQPNNPDLEFDDTDTFSCMIWFKSTTTSDQFYRFRDLSDTGGMHNFLINTSGQVRWGGYGSTSATTDVLDGNIVVNDGNWHCAVGVKTPETWSIYVDGEFDNSMAAAITGNFYGSNSVLRIGLTQGNGNSAGGVSMALFRISASAPTPEQIKYMYETEKVLFQEGAKATFYGTSDAVNALAYDDSTKLLHVGTNQGRSVFQGLRRVDNTTTAVGAAISASNGLVADE